MLDSLRCLCGISVCLCETSWCLGETLWCLPLWDLLGPLWKLPGDCFGTSLDICGTPWGCYLLGHLWNPLVVLCNLRVLLWNCFMLVWNLLGAFVAPSPQCLCGTFWGCCGTSWCICVTLWSFGGTSWCICVKISDACMGPPGDLCRTSLVSFWKLLGDCETSWGALVESTCTH